MKSQDRIQQRIIFKMASGKKLSVKHLTDVKQAFSKFDKNKDGRISKDEMAILLKEIGVKLSDGEVQNFMKKIDTDGDGTVDFNEFCNLMTQLVTYLKEQELKMRETFKVFDQDGDGKITQKELQGTLKKVGIVLTDEEAADLVQTMDRDGDGHINFSEFATMIYVLGLEV